MPCTDAKPDSEAPGDGYRRAGRDGPTRHTQTGNSGREAAMTFASEPGCILGTSSTTRCSYARGVIGPRH